jgi:hypothetical protein
MSQEASNRLGIISKEFYIYERTQGESLYVVNIGIINDLC